MKSTDTLSAPAGLLRRPAVLRLTGLSPSGLDREIAHGRFPRPVKLSPVGRAVAWPVVEVHRWIEGRIAARQPGQAA